MRAIFFVVDALHKMVLSQHVFNIAATVRIPLLFFGGEGRRGECEDREMQLRSCPRHGPVPDIPGMLRLEIASLCSNPSRNINLHSTLQKGAYTTVHYQVLSPLSLIDLFPNSC